MVRAMQVMFHQVYMLDDDLYSEEVEDADEEFEGFEFEGEDIFDVEEDEEDDALEEDLGLVDEELFVAVEDDEEEDEEDLDDLDTFLDEELDDDDFIDDEGYDIDDDDIDDDFDLYGDD